MKRKLTLIIVDDQQSAIDQMLEVIRAFVVDLVVIATFTDPVEALKYLRNNHVDFVLLDVEMPVVDGLAFAMQMPEEVKVIFCTAHRQYAVDAFDYAAVDYLMKPVARERFSGAIKRMKTALMIDPKTLAPIKDDYYYFMLKGPIKLHRTKIDFEEIVFIESRGDHTYFYLIGDLNNENKRRLEQQRKREQEIEAGKIVTKRDDDDAYIGMASLLTLQDINGIVNGSTLMQMHKSFILNTSYLRTYGTGKVGLKGLAAITLPTGSRSAFPEFYAFLERNRTPTS